MFFTSMITGTVTALGLVLGSIVVAEDSPDGEAPEVSVSRVVPEGLEHVEADVSRCRTAADAVLVFRLFLAEDSLPEDVKEFAAKRLTELQALAAAGKARVGNGWGTAAEAAKASWNAADEVDHAFEVLRLGNGKLAKEALDKAARLDPLSGRSRFAAGLVYAALNDPAKARVNFTEVVVVEPESGPAFNNLAVCELLSRRPMQAVDHFRAAAYRLPKSLLQPLVNNVALAIRLAVTPRGKMPDKALGESNDLLRWLGRDQGLVPAEGVTTYTLLAWDGQPCRDRSATLAGYVPRDRARTVAGVVVAADRVLVPSGIVQKEWALALGDPRDPQKQIPAEVIAVLELPGVALLRCEGLAVSPLPWAAAVPEVGTEVLAVGAVVPGTGRGWDVARGAIVQPPQEHRFIHQGGVARGLGGGPVVDPTGRGVGVVAALPRTEATGLGHGMAISVEALWPWLREHLPELVATGAGEPIGWEEVSQNARSATVAVFQVPPPPKP